ncbi:hypothetical protein WJX73_006515 [Symbiochloris irregularis]|uniref:Uncharacterized protein n=1 Tax=Symbiochloris irregularis TaxID=706552 RepID=A0AAW1NPJ8_9CHLO
MSYTQPGPPPGGPGQSSTGPPGPGIGQQQQRPGFQPGPTGGPAGYSYARPGMPPPVRTPSSGSISDTRQSSGPLGNPPFQQQPPSGPRGPPQQNFSAPPGGGPLSRPPPLGGPPGGGSGPLGAPPGGGSGPLGRGMPPLGSSPGGLPGARGPPGSMGGGLPPMRPPGSGPQFGRPPSGGGPPGQMGPPMAGLAAGGFPPPQGPPLMTRQLSGSSAGGTPRGMPGGFAPPGGHSSGPPVGVHRTPSSNGFGPPAGAPSPGFPGADGAQQQVTGAALPGRPMRHSTSMGGGGGGPFVPGAGGPPIGGGQFAPGPTGPSLGGAPSFGGPPGFAPPGSTGAGPGMLAPMQQRQLDPFEMVELGPAAPGQRDSANPLTFPRPVGEAAEEATSAGPPTNPRNCDARFMRLTVKAFPAQQALRARFQLPFGAIIHPLAEPQEDVPVVSELGEPFAPLPDDLLVNLRDSRAVIDALLNSLPNAFANTSILDSAMGPALQAAFMVMTPMGGKLMLFQSAIPSLGVGRVKPRDSPATWGTDNEAKTRQPEEQFFKKFAVECSRVQIAIDVFSCCAQATDLASLAALPKFTCGQLYYYPRFLHQRDEPKLAAELAHNLGRTTGWEAVMRIRTSRGLRVSVFHGHFFVRSSDLLALPQVDPDKAFAIQIAHEEAVLATQTAYVQCALLYTSSNGERRIRVHTLEAPVVADMADLYRGIDGGACATLLAKLAVEKSYSDKMDETRNTFQHKLVLALREYRAVHSAQARGGPAVPHNGLIFPPAMRYLPLWSLGALKTAALRGTVKDVPTDERISVGFDIIAASVPQLLRMAYPQLMPVHDPNGDWGRLGPDGRMVMPPNVPLALDLVDYSGAYLMDTGRVFLLWLGRGISPNFLSQVFGPEAAAGGAVNASHLAVEPPRQGSPLSERICALLHHLRSQRSTYPACFVVMQGTQPEQHVLPYFVEERAPQLPGYGDFLSQLHKAVLSKS